jgi:hypothetical protein
MPEMSDDAGDADSSISRGERDLLAGLARPHPGLRYLERS